MADAGRPRPATRRRAGVGNRAGPSPRAAGWLGPGRGHRKQKKQLSQESRRSHSRSRIGGTHNQVEISRITTTLHRKHVQPQRLSANRAGRRLSTATGPVGRVKTLRNFSAKGYRFVVFGVYPDIRLSAGGGPQRMTVIHGTARAPQQVLARPARPGLNAVIAQSPPPSRCRPSLVARKDSSRPCNTACEPRAEPTREARPNPESKHERLTWIPRIRHTANHGHRAATGGRLLEYVKASGQ